MIIIVSTILNWTYYNILSLLSSQYDFKNTDCDNIIILLIL